MQVHPAETRALSILIRYTEKQINKSRGFEDWGEEELAGQKYINKNQVPWTFNVKLKPISLFSCHAYAAAGDGGVCAIAWQQALPEAPLSSQVETDRQTDSALKALRWNQFDCGGSIMELETQEEERWTSIKH